MITYRLLNVGETVREGDEAYGWGYDWYAVGSPYHGHCVQARSNPIRRPMHEEPQDLNELATLIASGDKNDTFEYTFTLEELRELLWIMK